MARYRDELYDDREYDARTDRTRREPQWGNDDRSRVRREFEGERRPDYSRGRFGERADYDYDEPRYSESRDRFRDVGDEGHRSSLYDRGDLAERRTRSYYGRSRLRCRDIMTRDLAVATRDTTLREVAIMMKQEDTGVIPVVDYDANSGNGKATTEERSLDTRTYSRGKLVGLITDRDIVIRAVAESRDCSTLRAEEIMSTDIHSARPNDRVVDIIRTMGNKQVRRIPVVNENGYLVGMISMADIATETHEDRELADAIEDISKGSSFWSRIFS